MSSLMHPTSLSALDAHLQYVAVRVSGRINPSVPRIPSNIEREILFLMSELLYKSKTSAGGDD